MRVLFVNPSRAGQGKIPINIPILIAVLKQSGHEVKLFDFTDYDCFWNRSFQKGFFKPTEFSRELKKTDYKNDFEIMLLEFKPDMIAVSCLSIDFSFLVDFLKHFKLPPVVIGGIHATLNPWMTMNTRVFDYIVMGEGENALPKLLTSIEQGKTAMRVNFPIKLTDLKTLPYPDFDEFYDLHFYRPFDGKRYRMLNYELSRGCPFNCTYCVNGTLKNIYKGLGKYNRIKGIDQSITELKHLVDKYRFNFIRFWDEDFTTIPTRYLAEYAEAYKEIDLPFLIYARVDTVSEEKVKILKKMGCKTFAMGIESGSERIRQKVLNRFISDETIVEKFHLVRSYGIRTSSYNMIGLPYETKKDILKTFDLNKKANPDTVSLNFLEPYKGVPIWDMCVDQGLDPDYEVTFSSTEKPHFVPKDMTENELVDLMKEFYRDKERG